MNKITVTLFLACLILVTGGCRQRLVNQPNRVAIPDQPQETNVDTGTDEPSPEAQNAPKEKRVAFGSYDEVFRLTAVIPSGFEVEYVPEIRSLNIYDPLADGDSAREKSKIFIRFFEAKTFLTLPTVDILKREETTVNGHATVRYEIQKKSGAAAFPSQPHWRNERHSLVDIRFSDASPTQFYVFAYSPELPKDVFDRFIGSLIFDNDRESFKPPLGNLRDRVVKKPFAIKVSPDNSPIQPERFSGYHTGMDFEVSDAEREDGGRGPVEVAAFCGGMVRQKKQATGYGGVAVQECMIGNEMVTVIYGHLRLSSVVAEVNSYIAAGDTLGVLGADKSPETDGERRHLHFGIQRGSSIDIRGYVQSQTDLKKWMDPMEYFVDLR